MRADLSREVPKGVVDWQDAMCTRTVQMVSLACKD